MTPPAAPTSRPGHRFIDMTGQTFGRLTVVDRTVNGSAGRACWNCLCSCGRSVVIDGIRLRLGRAQGCGCGNGEKHGESRGGPHMYLYRLWGGIKQRCAQTPERNPNWEYYGARGISMHPEWAASFQTFRNYLLENLGERPTPRHSLDRINNDGNYEPGNVRWATVTQQNNNRRFNHRETCRYGHPQTPENLLPNSRQCRACSVAAGTRYRARRDAAAIHLAEAKVRARESALRERLDVRRALVAELTASGLSGSQVASRLGIGRATVVDDLRALAVDDLRALAGGDWRPRGGARRKNTRNVDDLNARPGTADVDP